MSQQTQPKQSSKAKPKEKLPRGLRRRGNSFVAYLTHPDGHPERRAIGNVSLGMAKTQRAIWQRELTENRYVKKVPRIERPTFEAIADAALEHAKRYKRAWDSDAGRIARMKSWWVNRTADEITTDEINEVLYQNVAPRGLCWTPTTSNEYRVVMSKIYSLAIERGEISVNPAVKAYRHQLNNERTRELSFAEEGKLRVAIRELYEHKEAEFDLALHTGVRRSNLYGIHSKSRVDMAPLDWTAVNLDWKVITLPRAKSGKGYVVALNAVAVSALEILRARSDGTGPVIRKPSGLEIHSCRKWFEACVKKASIEDFHWHDLRHTFASRLRRNGVPIEDIAELLGHSIKSLRMTLRYAHVSMDRLHEAVATLVPITPTQTGTNTGTSAVTEIRVVQAG